MSVAYAKDDEQVDDVDAVADRLERMKKTFPVPLLLPSGDNALDWIRAVQEFMAYT